MGEAAAIGSCVVCMGSCSVLAKNIILGKGSVSAGDKLTTSRESHIISHEHERKNGSSYTAGNATSVGGTHCVRKKIQTELSK